MLLVPGGRKAQMAYRRQRMILEGPLPASRGSNSETHCIVPCDPYVADMLQLVEEELSNLRQKTAQLQTERDSQVEMTTILNGQVCQNILYIFSLIKGIPLFFISF